MRSRAKEIVKNGVKPYITRLSIARPDPTGTYLSPETMVFHDKSRI